MCCWCLLWLRPEALADDHLVELDGVVEAALDAARLLGAAVAGGELGVVVDVRVEEPRAAQREVDALLAARASRSKVSVEHVGDELIVARLVAAVDVDVEELGQVEVHLLVVEREQPIAQIGLHARLFRVEQVRDGDGHVEVLRLEETQ